jgi:hypothetical protein
MIIDVGNVLIIMLTNIVVTIFWVISTYFPGYTLWGGRKCKRYFFSFWVAIIYEVV